MPPKKRGKRKCIEKRALKRRLIEISICVDGYIYKNKPISVEEAEKYIHEISLHQTKCNYDKHILQVIEKLKRCMKSIIEDRTKSLLPYQNVKTVTPENNQIDLFSESMSLSNEHNYCKLINNCNDEVTTKAISEVNNKKSNTADINVISDSENVENAKETNEEIRNNNDDNNNNYVTIDKSKILNSNEKQNELKTCKFNTVCTKADIIEVINMDETTTQVALDHDIYNFQYKTDENSKCLKPDQIYHRNILYTPKENVNDKCNVAMASGDIKCMNNLTKYLPSNSHGKSKKKKNSGKIQKHLQCDETLKTGIKRNLTKSHKVTKKNTKRVPKTNINNEIPNKRKRSSNMNKKTNSLNNDTPSITAPMFSEPNKCKHINIITNEVSLPVERVNYTEERNTVTQDSVTKQIRIGNDVQDLSWIEGIKYVREIGTDEFDETPNRFNESFWNNLLLPDGWKDDDFE